MKTTIVIAFLLAVIAFVGINCTENVTAPTETNVITTPSANDHVPPGPPSNATLRIEGNDLVLSWTRNTPYSESFFGIFHDGGDGIEPEPDASAPAGTEIIKFPIADFASGQAIRFVVNAAYEDSTGMMRWAGGSTSNFVTP